MIQIEGQTANDVWKSAAEIFRDDSNVSIQASRAGKTREILHVTFSIKESRQRWVTVRNPGINPAFAIVEVLWILSGRRDSGFLLPWNGQLEKFSGKAEKYHGAYGYRLKHNLGIDQLERAFLALRDNPEGRQVVLQFWDGRLDFPNSDGSPRDADIPCNIVSLLKVRDGKLEWMQILRSNDLFLGTPYNFIQFTTLQEILAGWLDLEVGTYHHMSDSLHIYERDFQEIHTFSTLSDQPNIDSLYLPKQDSDIVINEMTEQIERMSLKTLYPNELVKLSEDGVLPRAFHNLLLIVAGEAARRRGWLDLAQELVWGCTNPMLVQAWFGWVKRFDRDI